MLDFKECELEDFETIFTFDYVDRLKDHELSDQIDIKDNWEIIPLDSEGRVLTPEDIKERRQELKRRMVIRQQELGVIFDPDFLYNELGMGVYRENYGYNRFGEWCCSQCKVYKPRKIAFFPRDKRRRDGLGYICRECSKKNSKDYYETKGKKKREQKLKDAKQKEDKNNIWFNNEIL